MIIVKLKGGMGNQIFQYALGRAISIKHDTELFLDLSFLLSKTQIFKFTFREYSLDVFNIKANIVSENKIPLIHKMVKGKLGLIIDYFRRKCRLIKGIERKQGFDTDILNISNDSYLDGYWQSYKYFENIRDILIKDLTPANDLPENIKALKNYIESENSLCIHIRRGDYVGNPKYDILDKNYYLNGIKIIKDYTKIDKIYIFSDDINWCKKNINFNYPTLFIDDEYSGKKGEGHLILMSACKNFIIPNSSFSWWAAWLSTSKNKIVVAPKRWYYNKSLNTKDLIPQEWIQI